MTSSMQPGRYGFRIKRPLPEQTRSKGSSSDELILFWSMKEGERDSASKQQGDGEEYGKWKDIDGVEVGYDPINGVQTVGMIRKRPGIFAEMVGGIHLPLSLMDWSVEALRKCENGIGRILR